MAQRLLRAKQRIRLAGIPYEVPARDAMAPRHLSAREAVGVAESLHVETTVAIHFGTFPVLKGTPQLLEEEMSKRGSDAQLRVMRPGEKLDISKV